MIYTIDHTTNYQYSGQVYLDPLVVRLRPRSDAWQAVTSFALTIEPEPDGMSAFTDAVGNAAARAWFSQPTDRLTINARSEVEPLHAQPFDFIAADHGVGLPVEYRERNADLLARYRVDDADDPALTAIVGRARAASGGLSVAFLTALNAEIGAECRLELRGDGDPLTPEETLARGSGACRDLARVFLAGARAAGFAGRFVSGYHLDPPEGGAWQLHAWAEVYIPGAGWRGFDPSTGLVVTDRHVWVAAGPTHADCRPTEGTFRGDGATSVMDATIQITERAATPGRLEPAPG